MTECIVDDLKIVQVKKENRQVLVMPSVIGERPAQMIVKKTSVWQACKCIMGGLIDEAFFEMFPFGHIVNHETDGVAAKVRYEVCGYFHIQQAAVFTSQLQFTFFLEQ